VLRALRRLHALDRPLLLAVSRKDFIGAITGRPPRERLAGTLAAIAHGVQHGAHVIRVHDVAAAAEFLAVTSVLNGEEDIDSGTRLDDRVRWQQGAGAGPTQAGRVAR
jgi:dihydropteroate synthase